MTLTESNYQRWLNSPKVDEKTKQELRSMNQAQIDDAFFKDVEFGTAGMRGIIGMGTNMINTYTVRHATQGLSDYIKTHPNLWSGTPVHITFRCKQYMMNDVADSFGTNNRIETLPDDMMIVHVEASEASMLHWAIQFADAVEVLSPKSLRKQIAETLRNALDKYE